MTRHLLITYRAEVSKLENVYLNNRKSYLCTVCIL